MPLRKTHLFLPALTLAALAAVAPAAASAASSPTAAAAGTCTPLPTTKAFSGVDGDQADYSLAPGGNFENGLAGWTVTGSAAIASGNETLGISAGSKALRMPIGSTAVSPSFCIDQTNPHFRFAYKVDNVGAAGFIADVVYKDARGAVTKTEIVSSKSLSLTPALWAASPNSPLATIIPLNASTKSASVQIKFSVASPANLGSDITTGVLGNNGISQIVGGATGIANSASNIGLGATSSVVNVGVTIDSVMVDPYRRG
ncbi:MAG: hypothetical protein AAGC46_11845 [Solirubrobacteraceae bacterium]|nr:hypothetical protein [Patulibacter sp.]